MKKTIITAITLLSAATIFSAAEAASVSCKVGVVDVNQILSSSPQAKSIQTQLDNKYKPQVEKLQSAIQADEAKIKKDGVTMQASQKQSIQQDAQKNYAALNKLQTQYQQEFHKAVAPLMSDLQTTVNLDAKKLGYCVILPKAVTVYAADTVDLTAQVGKDFNKASGKGSASSNTSAKGAGSNSMTTNTSGK